MKKIQQATLVGTFLGAENDFGELEIVEDAVFSSTVYFSIALLSNFTNNVKSDIYLRLYELGQELFKTVKGVHSAECRVVIYNRSDNNSEILITDEETSYDEWETTVSEGGKTYSLRADYPLELSPMNLGRILKDKATNSNHELANYIGGLEFWDSDIPDECLERDELVQSVLNTDAPLIEENYYVGGGLVLRNKADLVFALDTSSVTMDGGERNELLRRFQEGNLTREELEEPLTMYVSTPEGHYEWTQNASPTKFLEYYKELTDIDGSEVGVITQLHTTTQKEITELYIAPKLFDFQYVGSDGYDGSVFNITEGEFKKLYVEPYSGSEELLWGYLSPL